MNSALVADEAPLETLATDATLTHCAACRYTVLVVALGGDARIAVEPDEVVCPRVRCPECRGKGRKRREPCPRCNGRATIGEDVPAVAIAVDEYGGARYWKAGKRRRRGEGLYRPHRCRPLDGTS